MKCENEGKDYNYCISAPVLRPFDFRISLRDQHSGLPVACLPGSGLPGLDAYSIIIKPSLRRKSIGLLAPEGDCGSRRR